MTILLTKLVKLMIIGIICLIIVGCVQDITLKNIDTLIFDDLAMVFLHEDSPSANTPKLTTDQIRILRKSIQSGTELTDLPNGSMPNYFQEGYSDFIVNKSTHTSLDLVYNRRDGYMYVFKVQVNYKEEAKYKRFVSSYEKYLMGIYKFKPSKEINKLVKQD